MSKNQGQSGASIDEQEKQREQARERAISRDSSARKRKEESAVKQEASRRRAEKAVSKKGQKSFLQEYGYYVAAGMVVLLIIFGAFRSGPAGDETIAKANL